MTTMVETIEPPRDVRLANLPIAMFSMVMGLAGLAIAAQKAEHVLGVQSGAPRVIGVLAGMAFITLAILYSAKALRHWHAVLEEIEHPVRLHFFPTISVSLVLLSIVALRIDRGLAEGLLIAGASLHLALTLGVLHFWFNREHFQVVHLNPAWFIPIVGNVLVPVAAVPLGYTEPAWLFFSIGIVFWLVLFSIVINRVLFHKALPERLAPTLFILIAPPAVAFLSYLALVDTLDGFARVLFYFALFMTMFLATQAPRLLRLRFFLSWWAYSFPLAAMTVATFVMYERTGIAGFYGLAMTLLAALSLVILTLIVRTGIAVSRHEICVPE